MNKINKLRKKYIPDDRRATYIVVLVFLWATWATIGAIVNNYNLQKKVDVLNDQIAKLRIDNDRLEFSNEFYKTDEYLDIAARRDLNKLAPGESILVTPLRDEDYLANETIAVEEYQRSNFSDWIDFLFNLDI